MAGNLYAPRGARFAGVSVSGYPPVDLGHAADAGAGPLGRRPRLRLGAVPAAVHSFRVVPRPVDQRDAPTRSETGADLSRHPGGSQRDYGDPVADRRCDWALRRALRGLMSVAGDALRPVQPAARVDRQPAARAAEGEGRGGIGPPHAGMTHELRTPLSGVSGLAGLLWRTRLDDEQRDTSTPSRRPPTPCAP